MASGLQARVRQQRARPQHLQVLRAVLHLLVVERVQLRQGQLGPRVGELGEPLERAALAKGTLRHLRVQARVQELAGLLQDCTVTVRNDGSVAAADGRRTRRSGERQG